VAFVGVVQIGMEIVVDFVVSRMGGPSGRGPLVAGRSKSLRLGGRSAIRRGAISRDFIAIAIGAAAATAAGTAAALITLVAFSGGLARGAIGGWRIAFGFCFAVRVGGGGAARPGLWTIAICIGGAANSGLDIELLIAVEIEISLFASGLDIGFVMGRGGFAGFAGGARFTTTAATAAAATTATARHIAVGFFLRLVTWLARR
jgi:hypothetical protein